ncbi:MAG: chorismate synthase [Defluviitaleaceae bacterium]|nr:chorismate synthase [Defluviitaleaceae bacterium]
MGSVWKNKLSLSIFGQSHGEAIGMMLDGLPAGEAIDMAELQQYLSRRAPGKFPWATPRKEDDVPEFLSGVVDGMTCGAPITAVIRNTNTISKDYSGLKDVPRPGHADYTAQVKYGGFQDVAGGGHFSGRLTAAFCIAGGICLQILQRRGVRVGGHVAAVGGEADTLFDPVNVQDFAKLDRMDFPVLDESAGARMVELIDLVRGEGDSVGGMVEVAVTGLPSGLGEPMFDGMENQIAKLAFAIPGVKGVEFGAGFEAAKKRGSENNDPFYYKNGQVLTKTNHHGGILGGITSGMPLVFRTAIKPTPSISVEQDSVSLSRGEAAKLAIKGRHDPCIVPRAVPCMVAVAAVAVLDAML